MALPSFRAPKPYNVSAGRSLWGHLILLNYFTDEKIGSKRNLVTCLRLHS